MPPQKRRVRTKSFRVLIILAAMLLLFVACTAPAQNAQPPVQQAPAAQAQVEAEPATAGVTEPVATPQGAPQTVAPAEDAGEEAGAPAAATFSPDATTVALEVVVEGLQQPLFVTHAGDGSGRIFVLEKRGIVHLLEGNSLAPTPFLNIEDRVRSSGFEQGLLGMAFAPDFVESGFFFVYYTDQSGATLLSRFAVDGSEAEQADPGSEFLVLRMEQPAANHNGGMIAFGPDGYLYVGPGDGGGANDRFNHGQNPNTLLGAMLRLDVTSNPDVPYTVPDDNPWVEAQLNGSEVLDEIWAIGLRNPWRFSFDRVTGDLWIADVGQNRIEEINWTRRDSGSGLNYGWPIMEGSECFQAATCETTGLELPVIEYRTQSPHCSVTGGYVYRGEAYPALAGVYFYSDYCSGYIWAAVPAEDGTVTSYEVLQSGFQVTSFGEDEAGELYLTDFTTGGVYRIITE
jgi:glucose/arabinose dehydrogenase